MVERLSHTQYCVGSAKRPAIGIAMLVYLGGRSSIGKSTAL